MMSFVGTEWIVDALDCRAEALCDAGVLGEVFRRVVAEMNLHPLGEAFWHQFPSPGGITGVLMLTESHLTCHTYPEFRIATFNLYCCRARPEWPWAERLREALGAERVAVRVCTRPAGASPEAREAGEGESSATGELLMSAPAAIRSGESGGGGRR